MNWTYHGSEVIGPGEFLGFVYLITCIPTGRMYIGKKLFWFSRFRIIKKKKKRTLIESDWREYFSSSNALRADVTRLGREAFSREILYLCVGRAQMNYLELREQIDRRVLETGEYYNDEIRARVHRHKSLITEERSNDVACKESPPQGKKKARIKKATLDSQKKKEVKY